jgi:peptidoglycan/xylan/chitin deacetylase (PgdA/CDA1 family)
MKNAEPQNPEARSDAGDSGTIDAAGFQRRRFLIGGAGITALAAAQGLTAQGALAQAGGSWPAITRKGTNMGVKGDPRPVMRLPNDAKIVFTVVIAFEAFLTTGNYGMVDGKRTPLADSYEKYAYDYGVWRILETLDRHGAKASFTTNGLAARRNPKIIRAMIENGHESYCHGWAQIVVPKDNEIEQERQLMRDTIDAIADGGGVRPVGWAGPGSRHSSNTVSLNAELGLMWNGDDMSSDIPFLKSVNGKTMVILPRVNYPTNDLGIFHQGRNPPSAMLDNFKAIFDVLYEEGQEGRPQWVEFLLHSDVGGRPVMSGTFQQALQYAKGFDGVWQARRRDLAEWILKNPPRAV